MTKTNYQISEEEIKNFSILEEDYDLPEEEDAADKAEADINTLAKYRAEAEGDTRY